MSAEIICDGCGKRAPMGTMSDPTPYLFLFCILVFCFAASHRRLR